MARLNDTFLLSLFRSAAIGVVRRNRPNRKFSLENRIDCAFPALEPKSIELTSHKLCELEIGLVLPPDHRLADQPEIRFARLRNERWILPPREANPALYDELISCCQGRIHAECNRGNDSTAQSCFTGRLRHRHRHFGPNDDASLHWWDNLSSPYPADSDARLLSWLSQKSLLPTSEIVHFNLPRTGQEFPCFIASKGLKKLVINLCPQKQTRLSRFTF